MKNLFFCQGTRSRRLKVEGRQAAVVIWSRGSGFPRACLLFDPGSIDVGTGLDPGRSGSLNPDSTGDREAGLLSTVDRAMIMPDAASGFRSI